MTYDEIFEAYYAQYRAEATTPPNTDDEYVVGMRLANEAINRWANYDNTMWKELFTTRSLDEDGDDTIIAGQTDYDTPSDMQMAGGFVRLTDPTSGATVQTIPIIEMQDAQFKSDNSSYCYFYGDPNNGFTLVINPAPVAPLVGCNIDYVYYKKPSLFTKGDDTPEMSEPYFIVHRVLASRFRSSRNPFYNDAKGDAEDVLTTMQLTNNSGTWADPWKLPDNSGSTWGG